MQAFTLDALMQPLQPGQGGIWSELLAVPSLSTGVYRLAAGATDTQQPHSRDEVYYIARGAADLEVGEERTPVRAGSIVFVPREAPHRFVDIRADLTCIVFFAGAHG